MCIWGEALIIALEVMNGMKRKTFPLLEFFAAVEKLKITGLWFKNIKFKARFIKMPVQLQ